jgi:hypothetical protein
MRYRYDYPQVGSREEAQSFVIICNSTLKASIALGALIPFYFLLDPQLINALFPLLLGGICLTALFSLRRIALSQVILLPVAWFLLACSMYHGVGPLLYKFGSEISINMADAFYYVDEKALWRTNLLNIISIAFILYFYSFSMKLPMFRPLKDIGNNAVIKRSAHIFSAIGVMFTLLTYSLRYGLGHDYLMPGIFYTLQRCSFSGLFLYSLLYFRKQREIKIPLLFMTLFVGYFALISLMKQEILVFVAMLFFGAFLVQPSIRKLVVAAFVVLVTLPALSTLTTYGRILTWTESSTQVSAIELIKAVSDSGEYIDNLKDANEGDQEVWRRFSYSSAQAFAMDAYDNGNPGRTFEPALWAFVPRLIYPDKPVISQGDVFTTLVKGENIGGPTSAGYFGEAYWNFGWFGVLLVSMFTGVLLAGGTQFNSNMASTGNYQYFPVALMALSVGYMVDGWFMAGTINSIPLMIFLYIMIKFISRKPLFKGRNPSVCQ